MEDKILFTETQIKQAELMLKIFEKESARFWADVLLSKEFLYKGTQHYINGRWVYKPSSTNEEITAKQIMTFMDEFEKIASEKSKKCLQSNECLAGILGYGICQTSQIEGLDEDEKKLYLNHVCGGNDRILYGGWDNDEWGVVSAAMKKAEISGVLCEYSRYRKTSLVLKDNKIFVGR